MTALTLMYHSTRRPARPISAISRIFAGAASSVPTSSSLLSTLSCLYPLKMMDNKLTLLFRKISSPQFVSLTSHNFPYTPVPYLPRSAFTPSDSEAGFTTPVVDPTKRSGDTWSMIFVSQRKAESLAWVIAETAN